MEKEQFLEKHLIFNIAWKKSLISVADKQKYIVFDADASDEVHKALYFDLEMNGHPLEREYQVVRILGLLCDRRLTWHAHIQRITNQAHRAYLSIYHRYKNARYITASWIPTIMEAYVLSKIAYMAAVWGGPTTTS